MDKKTIIIILLIILIVILVAMFATVSMSNNNSSTYERVNLSSTCSLELTKDFHKMTDDTSISGTYGGYSSTTTGKYLTDGDTIVQYTKTTDNIGALATGGADMNGNLQFGNTKIYSRDVFNYETQETVHIQGTDKEKVDHIADSVQFSTGKKVENNTTDQQNSKSPKVLAYKSDGTPMYTQAEVDSYMQGKYGDVNYHIGANGYIDMDEPGYDDAGHRVATPSSSGGSSSPQTYEQTYSSEGGGSSSGGSSDWSVITTSG